jgi:tripartite-type tricarboxylate transporter receptor subunit TctC
MRTRATVLRLLGVVVALSAVAASAQEKYPVRPVRIIVPFAPGGGSDIVARPIAARLSARLGQQFVVDNRPGAGGNVGMELAARAQPDGYTLMVVSSSYAANAVLHKLTYDPITGFEPVTLISQQPLLVAAHPSVPAANLKELLALARARPGALSYASSGTGGIQFLAAELFKSMAGVDILHVPYKGTGPAVSDLIAGQVQLALATIIATLPHVRSGRLRGLAVTSATRSEAAPDIPTVDESGVPGYVYVGWYCMLAPAKTSRHIVNLLNAEAVTALRLPEIRDRVAADGGTVVASTPGELGEHIRQQVARLSKLVKEANIRLDGSR